MVQPKVHMTGQLTHKWRPIVTVHLRRQAFWKFSVAKDQKNKHQEEKFLMQ